MVKTGLDFILTSQTEIISRVSEKTKAQNVPDTRERERDPDVHDSEAQQQLDETLFRNRIIGTNIMMVKQTRGLLRIESTLAPLVDEDSSEHRWRLFQSVSRLESVRVSRKCDAARVGTSKWPGEICAQCFLSVRVALMRLCRRRRSCRRFSFRSCWMRLLCVRSWT